MKYREVRDYRWKPSDKQNKKTSDALITKLSNTPEEIHVPVHAGQKCIVQVDAIDHSYIFISQFLSGFIGE